MTKVTDPSIALANSVAIYVGVLVSRFNKSGREVMLVDVSYTDQVILEPAISILRNTGFYVEERYSEVLRDNFVVIRRNS